MFEELANHAHHLDVVANAFDARAQAAHAPHDQFNVHAGLGGFVEQGNQAWIGEGIHFCPDVAPIARLGMGDFPADEVLHAAAQGDRCHQQFAEALLL